MARSSAVPRQAIFMNKGGAVRSRRTMMYQGDDVGHRVSPADLPPTSPLSAPSPDGPVPHLRQALDEFLGARLKQFPKQVRGFLRPV